MQVKQVLAMNPENGHFTHFQGKEGLNMASKYEDSDFYVTPHKGKHEVFKLYYQRGA